MSCAAADLLSELRQAGAVVSLEAEGVIEVRGLALTDSCRARIRSARVDLVAVLAAELVPGRGVRGDGMGVSPDGFALDVNGLVMLCPPCDGAGCDRCDDTGLRRAFEVAQ